MELVIKGKLPGLNEHIAAINNNRYSGNNLKQETEDNIIKEIKSQKITPVHPQGYPVHIDYYWYESNRKRDTDNISFAKKYVNDALVKAQIIDNDGQKHIKGFTDYFRIDKENPRVEVIIWEN